MSIKRILVNTIDTDLEYEVIGIDLAKNCVSAILLTTDGEIFGIDPGRTHQKLSNEPRYRSPFIGDLTRGTF